MFYDNVNGRYNRNEGNKSISPTKRHIFHARRKFYSFFATKVESIYSEVFRATIKDDDRELKNRENVLTVLPKDIFVEIFKLLDTETLFSISKTSFLFYKLSRRDDIWSNHVKSLLSVLSLDKDKKWNSLFYSSSPPQRDIFGLLSRYKTIVISTQTILSRLEEDNRNRSDGLLNAVRDLDLITKDREELECIFSSTHLKIGSPWKTSPGLSKFQRDIERICVTKKKKVNPSSFINVPFGSDGSSMYYQLSYPLNSNEYELLVKTKVLDGFYRGKKLDFIVSFNDSFPWDLPYIHCLTKNIYHPLLDNQNGLLKYENQNLSGLGEVLQIIEDLFTNPKYLCESIYCDF